MASCRWSEGTHLKESINQRIVSFATCFLCNPISFDSWFTFNVVWLSIMAHEGFKIKLPNVRLFEIQGIAQNGFLETGFPLEWAI